MSGLGLCNKCNKNEAVTYGPSGSYAVLCKACAEKWEREYKEGNPYVKCITCDNGYHLPPTTNPKTYQCISCYFSNRRIKEGR